MAIIHRLEELCKRVLITLSPFLLPLIIVTVALLAFGLGRLSEEVSKTGDTAVKGQEIAMGSPLYMGGEVVALNTGTVYYRPWCKGAVSMDKARQRWFKSAEAAQAAGYKPAKGCKGL